MLPVALNHMAQPNMRFDAFLSLAKSLGCKGVEFRNDLTRPLFDNEQPISVGQLAKSLGLEIYALAEVKAFNDWSDAKLNEADHLIQTAKACGAQAISLIPRNDGKELEANVARNALNRALSELLPLLEAANLIGLIEPLGFETCPLRYKDDAVEAIEKLGAKNRFGLIHDTFHHFVTGEKTLFPEHTKLVHISGLKDASVATQDMRDQHRELVDADDQLQNIKQIKGLIAGGYRGPISFEPFAPHILDCSNPKAEFGNSINFIESRLTRMAA